MSSKESLCLGKKKLAGYDEAKNKVPRVLIQEGYLCHCDERSLVFPGHSQTGQSWQEGLKVTGSGCSRSLVLEKGLPEFANFRFFCVRFNGGNVGKALCGAKNPAETSTTPTTVKSMSK